MAFQPTGAPVVGPIERAPFYATKLFRPSSACPRPDWEINEHSQVLTLGGDVIEGLYSASRTDLGMSLQSGVANLRGMVYGYRASNHMVSRGG